MRILGIFSGSILLIGILMVYSRNADDNSSSVQSGTKMKEVFSQEWKKICFFAPYEIIDFAVSKHELEVCYKGDASEVPTRYTYVYGLSASSDEPRCLGAYIEAKLEDTKCFLPQDSEVTIEYQYGGDIVFQ